VRWIEMSKERKPDLLFRYPYVKLISLATDGRASSITFVFEKKPNEEKWCFYDQDTYDEQLREAIIDDKCLNLLVGRCYDDKGNSEDRLLSLWVIVRK